MYMNKRISNIKQAISALESMLSSVDISPITRGGIDTVLRLVKDELNQLSLTVDELNGGPISETRTRIDRPIAFSQFVIYPLTSEIEIKGKRSRLPALEFHIIYNLALNNGKIVKFKATTSFNTHISVLRRSHPELKQIIERVKGPGLVGCYRLHAT